MSQTHLELRSTVNDQGELQLSLRKKPIPEPGDNEVLVQMQACPINPSDLAVLLALADTSKGKNTGEGAERVYLAPIAPELLKVSKARFNKALRVGNEGAGTVVKAGKNPAAQALLGKTVAMIGGACYSQYRCVDVAMCIAHKDSTSPREAASSFVNPLTALSMVENMRMDGFKGIIHTAAASNLGQMLNRICLADNIPLINIVRRDEQATLLKAQGAKHVINSSDADFKKQLSQAIAETECYLCFDAIGGGRLASEVLSCMEMAASRNSEYMGPYGSNVFKQVYIYGGLNQEPTTIQRNFGFSWGINGWLLTPFLAKAGTERTQAMQKRVVHEITSTFASHYDKEISLLDALDADNVLAYSKQATGHKYLLNPSL